ncbi:MAG: hypothetical protein K2M76_02925, partial [Muribaculaceae bacterium]|nr:hypothetical protein [Muribaculaceae bacterium]
MNLKLCIAAMAFVAGVSGVSAKDYTLKNDKMQIVIDDKGKLQSLKNLTTGQEYAGSGYLWRMYYERPGYKENEILAGEQKAPKITKSGNTITMTYPSVIQSDTTVNVALKFTVTLENDKARFTSEVKNNQPHTIVRELHYPIVQDMQLPDDYKLLLTHTGGQVYSNPKAVIEKYSMLKPYATPAQRFRQMNAKYPTRNTTAGCSGIMAANCYAFFNDGQGLYFGSHDPSFQDTGHSLRLYPDGDRKFTRLEAGFQKYPQCFYGETWTNDANVIAPYSGTWHETSKLYRNWANSWWEHRNTPEWVKKMNGWHRIIFKHQYGEYLFKYSDLNGRIREVGESVGCPVVFAFGWWEEGMDHGNPDYSPDRSQGGDEAWAKAIAEYKANGGKLLMYYNGKLIDRESKFYKEGKAKDIAYHDNTGAELTEQYRFTGNGSFLGDYDARTFVVADTRSAEWRDKLIEMADRARKNGANSVFYDQLGYAEAVTNWDTSREFAVPNHFVIADKARTLKQIRDHNAKYDPEFALGTEWLCDATANYCDYIHVYQVTAGPNSFIDWFRYTFPDVIISDREIRDDTDIPRRVNNTILKGLRNDIEIYRCRGLIDETPVYQAYLAKVNEIKTKYADLLLAGTYRDTDGFTSTNKGIEARAFTNGDGMAIVATRTLSGEPENTIIEVPGYKYVESATLGGAKVADNGGKVTLGQHDLA